MPEISLQALTQRILQTTPQVQGHPEILMAALERAAPLLDRQSKEDLMELRKQMATERLTQAGEIARARQQGLEAWRGAQGARADRRADQRDDAQESLETYRKRTGDQREAEEIGRNGRFQAGEEGKNTRSQATEAGRNQRFDTREARLAASTAVRQDQGYQRLQLQAQALAERAQATGDKKALGEWRATVDAMHKRATEIIQSNSVNSNLSKADKDALLAEQRQGYETAISGMRVRMGTSTPTGGATAPGAPAAPKVQGQVPQNAPLVTGGAAAADAPPLAMLKPNTVTTFANGQKWTVGPDGQPKKVD
jgi:hypothetical protein